MEENITEKPEIKRILNGHNEAIKEVERKITEPISKVVSETRNKEGEEVAGVMNYYFMEITDIVRKAAALGYLEAMYDNGIIEDDRPKE